MNIIFKPITKDNYRECLELEVTADQKKFVAPNSLSLVQATYEEGLHPLAIYELEKMIGFILYDYDQEIGGWSLSRLMIDYNCQANGYGKHALIEFIKYFKHMYPTETLYTSVSVENQVALKLYQSVGFEQLEEFTYTVQTVNYTEYRLRLVHE